KAGGPLYLLRLLAQHPGTLSVTAEATATDTEGMLALRGPLDTLSQWAHAQGHTALAAAATQYASRSVAGLRCTLPGPTGERNTYVLQPRAHTL
ncbi:UNVERIFIED_CONTAM: delta-1-pyrroline-5-carboxylate dehydrogenase, partial [Salmonella enterica subsp. enterica serovar Weltevreden]